MKKGLALLAATMLATPALAVPVTVTVSNYTITHNAGPDGLEINTQKILPEPYTIPGGLEPGGPNHAAEIFLIWTPESQANFDDYGQSDISFDMTVSAPAAGNGGVGGYTTTVNVGGIFNRVGLGVLEWDNSGIFDIAFGFNNTGLLRVDLTDANFNQGTSNPRFLSACMLFGIDCDLNGGIGGGDIVDATFTLIRDADPDPGDPNEVPEPAALGLLGMGLLGLAGLRRRKAA